MTPWALRVMSPWALGVGVLVSFTAVAGQNSARDWNVAPLAAQMDGGRTSAPATFGDVATGDFGSYGQTRALVHKARLNVGAPEDIRSIPDEREPHVELKPAVKDFPQVDRTRKGDPVVSMRPTMETRTLTPNHVSPGALGLIEPTTLSFGVEGKSVRASTALAPRPVMPGDEAVEEAAVTPKAEATAPPATTRKSVAAASPAQIASISTPTPVTEPTRDAAPVAPVRETSEALADRVDHGATPAVSRAVALGSSTPAQPDATPVEVSSFSGATLALGAPGKQDAGRPDYAALVDPEKLDREKRCLAEAVYFESRSEPEAGQAAVAQVVLNRVSSGLYPSTICGVVYQNRHHYHGCQFSFACEGKSLRITERESWERAVRLADEVMDGRTYISDVGRSTHYHANYVRPRWARALTRMDVIGRHIFYRLKPGQT